MDESISLIINLLLFLSISAILIVYIRKALEANREYTRAKSIIEEIVLSFNRELQSLNQKVGEIDTRLQNMQLPDVDQIRSEFASKIEDMRSLFSSLEKKIEGMRANVEKLSETRKQRELNFEEQGMINLPVRPAIPLKREKALAPLTPTELRVLEILSTEGDKTVREIKNRIGLTREHTGRLMKSLYDKGYVERRTDKIPYVYRIKKEMENILSNQNQ